LKISLLDKKGIVIASTDEASIGSDKSADNVYLKGKESTFIKEVHITDLVNPYHLIARFPAARLIFAKNWTRRVWV
jgi:hypothetical protein